MAQGRTTTIISTIHWTRTSKLSIKISLSLSSSHSQLWERVVNFEHRPLLRLCCVWRNTRVAWEKGLTSDKPPRYNTPGRRRANCPRGIIRLAAVGRTRRIQERWAETIHTLGYDPFIKSQLASRNELEGVVWCTFGHVTLNFWGERTRRTPPCGGGRAPAESSAYLPAHYKE